MATTTRTRRKTPAPTTDTPVPTPAPAAKKAAPKTAAPARKAAAKTAAARPAAPKAAAGKTAVKTAAKTAAKKAAKKAPAGKTARTKLPANPAVRADEPVAGLPVAVPAAPASLPAQVPEVAAVVAPAVTPEAAADGASQARRGNRRQRAPRHDPHAEATTQAVLAVLAAPAAPADAGPADAAPVHTLAPATAPASDAEPAPVQASGPAPQARAATPPRAAGEPRRKSAPTPAPAPATEPTPEPPPTGPAHSQLLCVAGDAAQIVWLPGHACPAPLRQAAQRRCNAQGQLSPEDDGALPQLLRLAQEAGHELRVDEAVWAHLAAHRDARHRLSALEAAYPDGPASPALQQLLRVALPLFQAEGALFAVVAGRALIADERGLGKGVQAIAAAQLWRRHFGVQRVLVVCAPAQRAGWQRAWRRFAGTPAADVQLIDGGHHQRQAQWSAAAGVRIVAPDALRSDLAHLSHWAPDLVVIDEPQQLGLHADDWAALQAVPHALVLCGASLADMPALMDGLVAWLDVQRLGPLAALRELRAASQAARALGEDDIERLTTGLSRLMLQRQRDDVADQLPAVVHSERLLPLAPGQRAAHDQHAAQARRLLAGWQASGWCSDTDQWRLAQALRGMQAACHRADPADPDSALADATVQAMDAALADLAGTGAPQAAVLCSSAADQAQLARRLAAHTGGDRPVLLLAPGALLPAGVDVVLQAGVPWRPRRQGGGPRGEVPAGQQWLYLVAQDGIDGGLFDTLAQRLDAPRSPADGGARGYLQGEALQQWLQLLQAALAATPTSAA